jgi:hypothetical protein
MSTLRVIDRFPEGFSWRGEGEGFMCRASHALLVDGRVWLIDPIDADGLDAELAALGPAAGVMLTMGRHRRDVASLARRLEVDVWAHDSLGRVDAAAPLRRFPGALPGTPLAALPLRGRLIRALWREVALWWPERHLLVVGESVGTAPYFLLHGERLGLHPLRRAAPPEELLGLDADRLLVGHGDGIGAGAGPALDDLLRHGASRRPPFWRLRTGIRVVRAR